MPDNQNAAVDPATVERPARLASIDAYRGFVMLLMMGEVLHFKSMAANFRDSKLWAFLAEQQSHVAWIGCSLHDLIQPSFSFLVGAALPFSIASRLSRGQSKWHMTAHALWRAVVLVALGICLRSINRPQTYFTFEDTLTQIGLGYFFLFLLGFRSMRDQWIALVIILVGYWAAFACYPLQDAGAGFPGHWSLNQNLAWAVDVWFLNLFPCDKPFTGNNGGYVTLSFIPTLGTMILGLLAGNIFRSPRTKWQRLRWFAVAGAILLALGWLTGWIGVCPVVKKIWTPSWTLFSGGWCFLILAAFYAIVDIGQWRGWALPLIVVGMNSIAAYCIADVAVPFISSTVQCHFGLLLPQLFAIFGTPYSLYRPLVIGGLTLLVEWLVLLWMYRRKVFLRV